MANIKILDEKTIEKIAAGEVIERPASIVKELIENSLDAGAKNIIVEIRDGGKSYIRITDDGSGINDEDLELAFKRHSTSKITSLDDLYSITSLGFRGEALSSVSHVARVEVMTKAGSSLSGLNASIEEGSVVSKEIVGTPKGTTMIVRDLFYNLPVRKNFLKSSLVESNQIVDIVYKIALGNMDVSFKLIRDNKVVLKTSRNNKALDHIYSILGREFRDNMVNISLENNNISINGYISNNKLYRSNRSHQYIYINGRYIDNKSIRDTIERNYKSIIPLNRFPAFIVFIDIDPKVIDINIHPTKQEIKFVDEDLVLGNLSDLVRESLTQAITIPKINFKDKKKYKKEDIPNLFDLDLNQSSHVKSDSSIDLSDIEKDFIVKDFTDNMNNLYEDTSIKKDMYVDKYNDFSAGEKSNTPKDLHIKKESSLDESANKTSNILSNLKPLGVVFKTYIISEDELNQKIYFIDQHAAHERIMYEKYLDEFKNESIHSQQLLSADIIELTNLEMNRFLENIDIFKALGFDLDEFGKNNIAIRAVPLIFGEPNVKRLFYDILDNMEKDLNSTYDIKLDKIMKLACTNAIKSGDTMSDLEILSLFDQLKKTKEPSSCPHGRPTILEMSKKEIEKGFLRII